MNRVRWNPERKAWTFVPRSMIRTNAMGHAQRHKKRRQLLELYGSHCWLCNKPIANEEPTIDHITPRAIGGTNAISNLRLAHGRCNWRRGDGPIPELLLTQEMRLEATR